MEQLAQPVFRVLLALKALLDYKAISVLRVLLVPQEQPVLLDPWGLLAYKAK